MTKRPREEAAGPDGWATGARPRRGRDDAEPTIQVSLRLPASWVGRLRDRALAASAREQRMITPQEIMRRIIATALDTPE
jgi:hypothetical protein